MLAHYNELDWAEDAGIALADCLSVGTEPVQDLIKRIERPYLKATHFFISCNLTFFIQKKAPR